MQLMFYGHGQTQMLLELPLLCSYQELALADRVQALLLSVWVVCAGPIDTLAA